MISCQLRVSSGEREDTTAAKVRQRTVNTHESCAFIASLRVVVLLGLSKVLKVCLS